MEKKIYILNVSRKCIKETLWLPRVTYPFTGWLLFKWQPEELILFIFDRLDLPYKGHWHKILLSNTTNLTSDIIIFTTLSINVANY